MNTTTNNVHGDAAPAGATRYEKRSVMDATVEDLQAFHQHPKAFNRLVMPPIIMQLHRDDRTSLTEGEVEFTLWFGPIPIRWTARHEPGPTPTSFADRMLKGPVDYWRHEHIFEQTEGGVALIDRLTIAHKPGLQGLITRLAFDGINLRILFFYRHLRTRLAVERKV